MNDSVKIEGFSYSYPDGTAALRDINLTIEEGQKVVLVGPDGSGKTTLLKAVAGYIRGSGSIEINGLELCSQNLRKIRNVMGCYLGDPKDYLFMPTVYEDVIYGPLCLDMDFQTVRRNVDFALEQMNLTDFIRKSPYRLSDGQKRSTAIATILSVRPEILLLDEPESGLSPRRYQNLIRLFREMNKTLIVSTCQMQFAATVADRVIVLYDGKISADGAPEVIFGDEKLMAAHELVG